MTDAYNMIISILALNKDYNRQVHNGINTNKFLDNIIKI